MDKMKLVPKKWRPFCMNKRGIPLTKGYDKEFDRGYKAKSREWQAAQSVQRYDYQIKSDIEREQGLAVRTRERAGDQPDLFRGEISV